MGRETRTVRTPYGTTQGGQAVDIFTMTKDHGHAVSSGAVQRDTVVGRR
jgi:hypothetical protein